MTKSLLWIGLKFVAITGPITWWWMFGGGEEAYWQVFRELAFPVLGKLGVTTFPPGLVKDRLLSFLPFLALMMITPRLSTARRYGGLAIGMAVIFVAQMALAWWAWWTHVRPGEVSPQAMSSFFPALILMDGLPFLVWAVVANPVLLELLSRIIPPEPQPAESTPAPAPDEPEDEPD